MDCGRNVERQGRSANFRHPRAVERATVNPSHHKRVTEVKEIDEEEIETRWRGVGLWLLEKMEESSPPLLDPMVLVYLQGGCERQRHP